MQNLLLAACCLVSLLGCAALRAQEEINPPDGKPAAEPVKEEKSEAIDGKTAAERGAAFVSQVAREKPSPGSELYPKAAVPCYAARLVANVDTEYALKMLDAAVTEQISKTKKQMAAVAAYAAAPDKSKKAPRVIMDPFDKVALVNTYFLAKDKIPKATALKIRDYVALWDQHQALQGYARGAWNYKLMMDASGYLAAEEWPEIVDRDGLNAAQIKEATRKRLMDDFDEIVTKNIGEYGATIYQAVNLSAIRMLAEFAKDPEMRRRAALTLDAMMLDIACTWNNGYNIGTASRAKYWYSTDTGLDSMASTAAAAWVFFGAKRPVSGLGYGHSVWMATPGTYKVPELIVQIAQDRKIPFVHRSYIASSGSSEVRRMTFHSPNYGLCSQWDHAGSPTAGLYKEARRNMLKWVSDKPSSTLAVCMENPYRPYALQEKRANKLGYGENGFAQYMQDDGVLLGLYAIPETVKSGRNTFEYPYKKVYVPFPATGSIVKRIEKDGWVFCHAGSMLFGFRSIKPYTWDKKPWGQHELLWVDARKNGWILQTAELAPFAGGGADAELDRFANEVLTKTKIDASGVDQDVPVLKYTGLNGRTLDFTYVPHGVPYKDQSKVNGKPIDYYAYPLFSNQWVRQDAGSPVLLIKHGGKTLTYDFSKWSKTES